MAVSLNVRMTASYSLLKAGAQWFGEARECSYIQAIMKITNTIINHIHTVINSMCDIAWRSQRKFVYLGINKAETQVNN
mgnify:CR=1 FL=1